MKSSIRNKKGFTIVELVIVIAVIAILAAVLIPTFANLVEKANQSADEQACRNMNAFLAMEDALNGVNSILDVHDAFKGSGYDVQGYTTLAEGTQYFYSKEDGQIVYVDEDGAVLYPETLKGTTQGDKTWLSLSMNAFGEGTKPATYSAENNKITATVTKGEEYYYVVNQYNDAAEGTGLELTVIGTIDMKGTDCTIKNTHGEVKITGSNSAVIKNLVSVKTATVSSNNAQNNNADYDAGGLISNAKHAVTISDITLENIYVRTVFGGNVALLIGYHNKSVTISRVNIKNSMVIGQRGVAALIGSSSGSATLENISFENVSVMTIGGKAAKYIAFATSVTVKATGFTGEVTLDIYHNDDSKQNTVTTANEEFNLTKVNAEYSWINSVKSSTGECETYFYIPDAEFVFANRTNNAGTYTTTKNETKGKYAVITKTVADLSNGYTFNESVAGSLFNS